MIQFALLLEMVFDIVPSETHINVVAIQRYNGNWHIKNFSCQDQYRCVAFAQLTCRESLRDIEACLKSQSNDAKRLRVF